MTTNVQQEIELKFTSTDRALTCFRETGLARLRAHGWRVEEHLPKTLVNKYFDTPDHALRQAGAGLRVRVADTKIEQTLKTRGQSQLGIQQRHEFNQTLQTPDVDVDAFPASVWPSGVDKDSLAASVVELFSTDFSRCAFVLEKENSKIELVFDQGSVRSGSHQEDLCEVELELWQGTVSALLDVAWIVIQDMPARLCNTTKAARGYYLLQNTVSAPKALPSFVEVDKKTATEEAFLRAISTVFEHWQWHEDQFALTQIPKLLEGVAQGITVILQTITLYVPVLQCPELLLLHQQCIAFAKQWDWVEQLHSLRYLLSKKSSFTPFIGKYPALQSYLQGRKEGLLRLHQPKHLMCLSDANQIKMTLLALSQRKPWRGIAAGYDVPIAEHGRGWLSQAWQLLHQAMPTQSGAPAVHYIAVSGVLRQALTTGFLVGNLYAGKRGDFRLPWADIMLGVEELKALVLLQTAIKDAEMPQHVDMLAWVSSKINSLLFAIDRTREQALSQDIYWAEE